LILAAIPFIGPAMYFFADTRPRRVRLAHRSNITQVRPVSPVLKNWNEREHVYLTWAGLVFLGLAIVACWINDWSPGRLRFGLFGAFTDVDAIFQSLLVLIILAFGDACVRSSGGNACPPVKAGSRVPRTHPAGRDRPADPENEARKPRDRPPQP